MPAQPRLIKEEILGFLQIVDGVMNMLKMDRNIAVILDELLSPKGRNQTTKQTQLSPLIKYYRKL